MTEPTKLVLQERKLLFRLGLAEILAEHEIEVSACAADDVELRDAVARERPHVVVLELDVPWDLPQLSADLRELVPELRVVALHPGRLSDHGRLPREANVDALAAYGGTAAAIVAAVRGASAPSGEAVTERRVLPSRTVLTAREQEVLRHLAKGMTASTCAAALRVSPKTIDNHKQRIFAKLGVQNQAHAVALAHRIGLLGHVEPHQVASG